MDGRAVLARRFSSDGSPQGDPFQVNTITAGSQENPQVASTADGRLVVVWSSQENGSGDFTVRGQRFDDLGSPNGEGFQVSGSAIELEPGPDVASRDDGSFVVAWNGDPDLAVQGLRFDSEGMTVGPRFQVDGTAYADYRASVATRENGEFVVAWATDSETSAGYEILARRYEPYLFVDGFESGDLARWSSATP